MKITEPLKIPDSQIELKIVQDKERFCYGIDAILLSNFALESIKNTNKAQNIFDLCTGNAIIPLLMVTKLQKANFAAIEIQSESAQMAQESVSINNLENRIKIIEGDLKEIGNQNSASFVTKCSFDFVTANPPYMNNGRQSDNEAKMIARHEIKCVLDDVVKSANYLLKSKGTFFMIHRPNRLCDIFESLKKHNFSVKRLQFVQPQINKEPTMVLIESQKDSKCELKTLPVLISNF